MFVIPFPAIDPVLIELGPLAIRWYALSYVVGIALGWLYLRRLVATDRLWGGLPRPTKGDIDDYVVWVAIGVILGGRIGYVLFYNLPAYEQDPLGVFRVWEGGMAFHGGFLGAGLATLLFAWRRSLRAFSLLDLAATATPIGLFLGRLANFVNGELFGRPSDVPWAMVFPLGGPEPRHPSQLYEAGLEGIVLFTILNLLVWKGRALRRPGLTTGLFITLYGCSRFFVEFFREPDAQLGFFGDWLTMGMILSLPMILAGLGVLAYVLRRERVPVR